MYTNKNENVHTQPHTNQKEDGGREGSQGIHVYIAHWLYWQVKEEIEHDPQFWSVLYLIHSTIPTFK